MLSQKRPKRLLFNKNTLSRPADSMEPDRTHSSVSTMKTDIRNKLSLMRISSRKALKLRISLSYYPKRKVSTS